MAVLLINRETKSSNVSCDDNVLGILKVLLIWHWYL